jgi:hypothetical protein
VRIDGTMKLKKNAALKTIVGYTVTSTMFSPRSAAILGARTGVHVLRSDTDV